jgi:uncharacterized protein (DUF488 family)
MKKKGQLAKVTEETEEPPLVLTIGHSTRPLEAFIDLLKIHDVEMIVDVRTVPRSRHNAQFNLDTLPEALRSVGIGYEHMSGLGGLRHALRNSPNMGWRNSSFRGFADYMQTEEFEKNLENLILLARRERICLMCAEAVPWRCHRSLVADALQVRGIPVGHITSKSQPQFHRLTPFAQVDGTQITYPPEAHKADETERPES